MAKRVTALALLAACSTPAAPPPTLMEFHNSDPALWIDPPPTTTTTIEPVFAALPPPLLEDDEWSRVAWCDRIPDTSQLPVKLTADTHQWCGDIAPWFHTEPDLWMALLVVECESNGDPYANDRAWSHLSIRPQGIFSHMSAYWPERSMRLLGRLIDPYDARDAAELAAALVYEPNGRGWNHWWSCRRKDGRAVMRTFEAMT